MKIETAEELEALPANTLVQGRDMDGYVYYRDARGGWRQIMSSTEETTSKYLAYHYAKVGEGSREGEESVGLRLLYHPECPVVGPDELDRLLAAQDALNAVLALFVMRGRALVDEFGSGVPVYVDGKEIINVVDFVLKKHGLVNGLGDVGKEF